MKFTGVISKQERHRKRQQRLKRQRVREQEGERDIKISREIATHRHPKHGLVYVLIFDSEVSPGLSLIHDDHGNEFWVKRDELTEVKPKRLPQESHRTTDEKLIAKLCPICETQLTGKQRTTCSAPACRVALLRRRKKGMAALVAVAGRALRPQLARLQLAARRKLRVGHKQRRQELRAYVLAETQAMKLEIEMSDIAVAEEHAKKLKAAADAGKLGTLIAREDRKTMTPKDVEQWRARNLPRHEKLKYWRKAV